MMVTRHDWTDRQEVREVERIVSAQAHTSVEDAVDVANIVTYKLASHSEASLEPSSLAEREDERLKATPAFDQSGATQR